MKRRQRNELIDEIQELKKMIADLQVQKGAAEREVGLQKKVNELRKELTELEIQKLRVTEEHEKEKREVLHMVGLEKKRQQFEIDAATRETGLTVREENLSADKKRFAEEMKFQRERFEKEVGYLKEMMSDILDRLPKIETLVKVGARNGSSAGEDD